MELVGAIAAGGLFFYAGLQISKGALDAGDFIVVLLGTGLLFMSLLFMSQGLAQDLWVERGQHTLRRVLASPQRIATFLLGKFLGLTLMLFLSALALTSLGFVLAWRMDSTQGFHAIMNLLLMPMWLLSGSFFPAPASGWLAWVVRLNPLTYGTAGLRRLAASPDTAP